MKIKTIDNRALSCPFCGQGLWLGAAINPADLGMDYGLDQVDLCQRLSHAFLDHFCGICHPCGKYFSRDEVHRMCACQIQPSVMIQWEYETDEEKESWRKALGVNQ